jgi:2',3'-cyclic-nucleotide 2'-phosphodiesterase/3'-nucleotidase/5'-nucleotidase
MLTGWQQNKHGVWFYLDPASGAMKTGWLQDNGNWYFLNTAEGDLQGSMVRGWWTWRDNRYFFNDSGVMVTGWYQIGGRFYYFYPQGSTTGTYGHLATNTKIGSFTIGADGAWVQ